MDHDRYTKMTGIQKLGALKNCGYKSSRSYKAHFEEIANLNFLKFLPMLWPKPKLSNLKTEKKNYKIKKIFHISKSFRKFSKESNPSKLETLKFYFLTQMFCECKAADRQFIKKYFSNSRVASAIIKQTSSEHFINYRIKQTKQLIAVLFNSTFISKCFDKFPKGEAFCKNY